MFHVRKNKLDLGLATDGDADRFGIVDADGAYITPNEVITLLLYHFIHNRKTKKTIAARTVATTHMIDKIAEAHGYGTMNIKKRLIERISCKA